MTGSKLVLAYIGNGKSANRYHIPYVLQRRDRFAIKTIYSPRIRHDVWEQLENVAYTEDPKDVFADPDIDLVVVNTGVQHHYEDRKSVV